MIQPESEKIKPIIARPDQEGRMIGDVCHVEGCPCAECEAAERADLERWPEEVKHREKQLEAVEEPGVREAQIMAAWATFEVTERGIASMFDNRFNGGWRDPRGVGFDRQEYRFDPRRGRWMAFDGEGYYSGHWRPATAILDAVGGLVDALCDGKPSMAAKWGQGQRLQKRSNPGARAYDRR